MKCKFWDEDCIHLEPCEVAPAKFWTPAERAGLKAMGEQYQNQEWHWLKPWFDVGVLAAIRAYVAASRKVKEKE